MCRRQIHGSASFCTAGGLYRNSYRTRPEILKHPVFLSSCSCSADILFHSFIHSFLFSLPRPGCLFDQSERTAIGIHKLYIQFYHVPMDLVAFSGIFRSMGIFISNLLFRFPFVIFYSNPFPMLCISWSAHQFFRWTQNRNPVIPL